VSARDAIALAQDAPDEWDQLVDALKGEVVDMKMEPDAVRVLLLIARRLNHGRAIYGDMDIASSPRNFDEEALDEDADGLVYRAAETIRQMRRARG
jgi:hypothetical protein